MPTALANFGLQTAGQAVGAGMGMLLGNWNDKRQLRQQERLQELQIKGQKEMGDYNYRRQKQMWEETSYKAQKEQMEKAGLNPALMYGMGGGGGQSTGTPSGNVAGAQAPSGGGEPQGMAGMGMQMVQAAQLTQAQIKLLEAQANNLNTDTTKKAGVDTANVQADTENKILAKIITEYTGKEAELVYKRITAPNIGIASKTNQDELEARQGIATTIYELWKEGQLKEKSLAEIEGILLKNAKSRAETVNIYKTIDLLEENIKGAKLDNIIKELESQIQTQTGIDKSSPTWMKILARLFIGLTTQ